VTLCVLAAAAWGHPHLLGAILLVGFSSLIFLVWRIEAVFKSNPEMAILEGKEIIQYRQIELKSKDHAPIQVIEITTDPELPERSSPLLAAEVDEREDGCMARTLILTISGPEIAFDEVEAKLDKAKDWLRYAPGSWLIHTNRSADIWYSRISDVVAAKGTLVLICEANLDERAGRLSPAAWKWMKNIRNQTHLVAS